MISMELILNGDRQFSAKLSALGKKLQDRTLANRALAIQLQSWVFGNYDSEGSKVGGWPALAASTRKYKQRVGKERMMFMTGHLRASLLSFSDSNKAGIGSQVAYSIFHEKGTANHPRRRILPNAQEATQMAIGVYDFFVKRSIKEAGL